VTTKALTGDCPLLKILRPVGLPIIDAGIKLNDWLQERIIFVNPEYFIFIPIIAALFILWFLVFLWKLKNRPSKTYGSRYPLVGFFRLWFYVNVSAFLVMIALARPLSKEKVIFEKDAIDVVVGLDYSLSMRARDLGNLTRLDVAKREIVRLVSDNVLEKGDRVALFIFGTISNAVLPLSTDFNRFVNDVANVNFPKTLMDETLWSTDLALNLQNIYEILDKRDEFDDKYGISLGLKKPPRVIILFTDGEDQLENDDLIELSVREFRERNIEVYSVGIGSRAGVSAFSLLQGYKIDIDYPRKYVKDWGPNLVTRLETETLNYLASRTGGDVFTIESSSTSSLDFLREAVDGNRSLRPISMLVNEGGWELWRLFVYAALAVMFVDILPRLVVYGFEMVRSRKQ